MRRRHGRRLPHHTLELDDRVIQAACDLAIVGNAELPVPLVRMNQSMGLAERLGLVVDSVLPSPTRLRQMYGRSGETTSVMWYYLVRPAEVVRRRGRECWHLLRDSEVLSMAFRYGESRRIVDRWLEGHATPAFPQSRGTPNAP